MARMSYRERRFRNQLAMERAKKRELTPQNLAMDIDRKYDVIFRKSPWELEFIFSLRECYPAFELSGDELPPWISLRLNDLDRPIDLTVKRVFSYLGLHIVCEYPKGAVDSLKKRSWLHVMISVPDGSVRTLECKFRKWRRE